MTTLSNGRVNAAYIRTACTHEDHMYSQVIAAIEKIITPPLTGSDVITLYIDFGQKGTFTAPAAENLIADIKAEKIDTLYMTDATRISRNIDEVQSFIDLAKAKDVNIVITN